MQLQSEIVMLNNKLVRAADLHNDLQRQFSSAEEEISAKNSEAGFMQENMKQLNAKLTRSKLDRDQQRVGTNKKPGLGLTSISK
jgi:chromosome segregation ATPase